MEDKRKNSREDWDEKKELKSKGPKSKGVEGKEGGMKDETELNLHAPSALCWATTRAMSSHHVRFSRSYEPDPKNNLLSHTRPPVSKVTSLLAGNSVALPCCFASPSLSLSLVGGLL